MKKRSHLYQLVLENNSKKRKEYFHFDAMTFKKEKPKKGVKLSTIDALTTLFDDHEEMFDYLGILFEFEDIKLSIEYKPRPNGEFRYLDVVWADKALSSLSKISEHGVDFTGSKQYDTIMEIIEEIKKEDTGFIMQLLNPDKEDIRISDKARALVSAHSVSVDDRVVGSLIQHFKDYDDCRPLYLAYKEYKESNKRAKIIIRSWHQNKEDVRISDKARALVSDHSVSNDDRVEVSLIQHFKDYDDCRPLYPAHKEYKESNKKAKIIVRSWHQKDK